MKLTTFFQRAALLSVLTTVLAFNSAHAQIPTDSIVADFNEFVRLLEETHPDPYTNYGGKPFFRLEAMDTRFGLIEDSVTSTDELARRITKFLAPLEDGHTNIDMGLSSFFEEREPEMGAPIDFWPISDGVVIESITTEHKDLIGSRLIAIEGIPLKEICTNLAAYHTAENEIGRITNFCFISSLKPNDLRKVIPDMRQDSITFLLQTPKGKQMNLTLPLIDKYGSGSNIELSSVEHTKPFPSQGNLSYLFVDDKKNSMYFRSSQIVSRDALEIMISHGMDVGQYLTRTYTQYKMKKNKSKNLIIDLRGNSGGFTPITLPTLYQLWGDRYLEEAPRFGIKFIQLFSPLYMKKMNITMEELNAEMQESGFILGDYISTSEDDDSPEEITDEFRDRMIEQMASSVKDKLMAQHGKPVYTPEHVYVLINPTTYSAAFHYAFFLWKMGATVVGLPSKQAPNTYMEATPFELPRTKLKGSISNSLQLFMPTDDPRAHQFTPDLMPTYEDYMHYNFDKNTELLFLLDHIKNQK